MTAIMAESYPDLFSAAGIHSGLASGSASDVVSAFAAMRGDVPHRQRASVSRTGGAEHVRIILFQGTADRTVAPVNAERIILAAGHGRARTQHESRGVAGQRGYTRRIFSNGENADVLECWMIDGAEHAWSGGDPAGTFSDPQGPNATSEMLRFFFAEAKAT